MDTQSIKVQTSMRLAEYWGKHRFRSDPDIEVKTCDAVSRAWENAMKYPDKPATSIAWYSIRQVAVGRHFGGTKRSVDVLPEDRKRFRFERVALNLIDLTGPGVDPAEQAAMRHDLQVLLDSLSPKQRKIALALAVGERTMDVAKRFELTPGRISQLRLLFFRRWEKLTA